MFNPKTPSRRQLLVAAATLAATAWCSSARWLH